MVSPYARSPSSRNGRSASPALSTRSLLQSIPASLRFAMGDEEPPATQNSGATNSTADSAEQRHEDDCLRPNEDSDQDMGHSNSRDSSSGDDGDERRSSLNDAPFRTANSACPSTNLPMAPANQQQWEQVANAMGLEGIHRAEALRTSSITGDDNRFYALVCVMHRTRQDMDKHFQHRISDTWKPSSDLGTRIIKIIRKALSCHTIASYTNTMDSNKEPIAASFHRKALEAIIKKSPSWKSENLPPRFGTSVDDLADHEVFMNLFKAKLRHVRDEFRLLLLTNIHVPSAKKSETPLPVPNIATLQGMLMRYFDSTDSRTNDEIDNQIDLKAKARFAYLRLEAAKYHMSDNEARRERAGRSHWDWVDDQLEALRQKDRKHRKAFDVLALVRDEGFFNGRNTWAPIKENPNFGVPSEEDVVAAIPYLPAT
ncbi:hypothetical protein DFH28DRAFT_1138638 [Melampsora americana]|nr:hypothetical protein DFH28DRAFT_1138638 [Melampsora americana]